MRFLNGQLILFQRTFSNDGPSDHTWLIACWHSRKSITWRWALMFSKPYWFRIDTQETMLKPSSKLKGGGA